MNLQADATLALRRELFAANGVPCSIWRDGAELLATVAVVVKQKSEDADKSLGASYVNNVDVLISGDVDYAPRAGDLVFLTDRAETGGVSSFIVKPTSKELWRWDDPYAIVRRVHVQRRS